LIEQRVTPTLLSEIAAEHARGRRLFVATTNLDAGRRVVWNMGAIAARGEEGLKLFRDVLLASSSIPGFFPPVAIEVEANGKKFRRLDGGRTVAGAFLGDAETVPLAAQHVAPAARAALYHRQLQARTRVQNAGSQYSRHTRSLHRRGADGGAARGSHVDLY